jgi:hypothetical protein
MNKPTFFYFTYIVHFYCLSFLIYTKNVRVILHQESQLCRKIFFFSFSVIKIWINFSITFYLILNFNINYRNIKIRALFSIHIFCFITFSIIRIRKLMQTYSQSFFQFLDLPIAHKINHAQPI